MANQFKIKITENGSSHLLPATMTREDAEWEKKMQLRMQNITKGNKIKVEIVEA
jgi:hypothetical protein